MTKSPVCSICGRVLWGGDVYYDFYGPMGEMDVICDHHKCLILFSHRHMHNSPVIDTEIANNESYAGTRRDNTIEILERRVIALEHKVINAHSRIEGLLIMAKSANKDISEMNKRLGLIDYTGETDERS